MPHDRLHTHNSFLIRVRTLHERWERTFHAKFEGLKKKWSMRKREFSAVTSPSLESPPEEGIRKWPIYCSGQVYTICLVFLHLSGVQVESLLESHTGTFNTVVPIELKKKVAVFFLCFVLFCLRNHNKGIGERRRRLTNRWRWGDVAYRGAAAMPYLWVG